MNRKEADTDFLYAGIAARIRQQVKENLLKPGDKLPSVRALSREQGISISTASRAYVELENKGIIEARPKSGYYIRHLPARYTRPPGVQPLPKTIEGADVGQMIAMVRENVSQDGVLALSV